MLSTAAAETSAGDSPGTRTTLRPISTGAGLDGPSDALPPPADLPPPHPASASATAQAVAPTRMVVRVTT